jgi:hypothetical protein
MIPGLEVADAAAEDELLVVFLQSKLLNFFFFVF